MALLAGSIFVVYANTLHVPYLLDDADSIEKNDTIKSFATALFPPRNSGITVSGRPLLNLTLAINYRLHGTDVVGYHVGNILIHIGAALTLFGVVRRTLKQPSLAARYSLQATPLALAVAALWALHPLQTESVTYIIQRAESLVGLCYLFTLYAFIRAVEKPSRFWPTITVIACFLGMAAKEVMATAPLVIFLYDRTFVSGTFRESWARHKKLHLSLVASWLLLGAFVISSGGRGTSVGYSAVSWSDYAFTQGPGIETYLLHSIVPVNLVFDYGAVIEKQPSVIFGGLLCVLTLFVGTCLFLQKSPKVGFLGAWFFLVLAPTSSVIPVATQTLAEHRMYLPLAALCVGVILLIHRACRKYYWSALVGLTLVLGVMTVNRNVTYRTNLSIWEDTVRKVPDNPRALSNLGLFYLNAGRLDEAIHCFSEALELVPNFALAITNLGQTLITKGSKEVGFERSYKDIAEDIKSGRNSIEIEKLLSNKSFMEGMALLQNAAVLHCNFGVSLLEQGRIEDGIQHLKKAIVLDPLLPKARYHLSNALADAGQTDEAIIHLEALLKISPPTAELLSNLGVLYARVGRLEDAVEQIQHALKLDPNHEAAQENLTKINAYLQSHPAR